MTLSSPESQYFQNAADYFDMLCFTPGRADHLPSRQVWASQLPAAPVAYTASSPQSWTCEMKMNAVYRLNMLMFCESHQYEWLTSHRRSPPDPEQHSPAGSKSQAAKISWRWTSRSSAKKRHKRQTCWLPLNLWEKQFTHSDVNS